jgi:hypothetical protein
MKEEKRKIRMRKWRRRRRRAGLANGRRRESAG